MTTFVSLTGSRLGMYMQPKLESSFVVHRLNSKFGIEIRPRATEEAPVMAEVLSGKGAGTMTGRVAANQRAVLRLGTLSPNRYQALICINPDLNTLGVVQHPTLVEPKEVCYLDLVISAHKEIDLSLVDWWARAYLLE